MISKSTNATQNKENQRDNSEQPNHFYKFNKSLLIPSKD